MVGKRKFFPNDFPDCWIFLRNKDNTGFKVRKNDLYIFEIESRCFFEVRDGNNPIAIVETSDYIIDFVSARQMWGEIQSQETETRT